MKRFRLDYVANQEYACCICGRRIFPGMTVFNAELKGGRKGVAHSLCGTKLTPSKIKITEEER